MPTVDTTRYSYLLASFMRAERHALITGDVGVGKTSIVFSALGSLEEHFVFANLNFSARTSSVRVSDGIESRVEKRTKDTYAPPGGKKLVIFIDDLNMPEKEIFGAQPPLELELADVELVRSQRSELLVDTRQLQAQLGCGTRQPLLRGRGRGRLRRRRLRRR